MTSHTDANETVPETAKKLILAALPEGPLFNTLTNWSQSIGATLRRVAPDAPDLIAVRFDLAIVDMPYYRERYFEYLDYISQLAEELDNEEALLSEDEKVAHEARLSEFMAAGRVICIEHEWTGQALTLVSPTPDYFARVLALVAKSSEPAPSGED